MGKTFGYSINDYNTYAIALSHLDAAWLWTVKDAKFRAYKTFHMAMEHIKKYPYFSISLTSPQYFEWIKTYDTALHSPAHPTSLWDATKKYVAAGKIDICGGSWIEPDLNVPSGEALIRQRLLGQLFYLRNFGKISKVETLLDVFGYPNTLPQILVKSGAESFWTTKLTWNDYTVWPFANFNWKGLDGTTIFTHQFKFNIMAFIDLGQYKTTARRPRRAGLEYNSNTLFDCENCSPFMIAGISMATKNYSGLDELKPDISPDYVKTMGIFYGWGDGGKGPLDLEVKLMENMGQIFGTKHTTTHNYFKLLKKDVGKPMVTWQDELYLEYHRGTLTTQAKVKQGNRNCENALLAAETLSTLALLSGAFPTEIYDHKLFTREWKSLLLNQFHDILPGSSIPEVYLKTWEDHEKTIALMTQKCETILQSVYAQHVQPSFSQSIQNILVYNPCAAENECYVPIGQSIIPFSHLGPYSMTILDPTASLTKWEEKSTDLAYREATDSLHMENSKISVKISKRSGTIMGVYLKALKSAKNLLYGTRSGTKTGKGASLKVFHEDFAKNDYPAWNICKNYTQNPLPLTLVHCKMVHSQKDYIEITVRYTVHKTQLDLSYILRSDSDKLDISCIIDLQNPELLVKFFMPLNLKSNDVICETQFGTVVRKRVPATKMQAAKWEFSMQKWIDVSDIDVGVALLNRDRYGASANRHGVSLTLVRSAPYPGDGFHSHEILFAKRKDRPKYTDLMIHSFSFAILPHEKTWQEAIIPARALAYNNPPIIITPHNGTEEKSGGTSPMRFPIVLSDHSNVLLSACKPSEWMDQSSRDTTIPGFTDAPYFLVEDSDRWQWDSKTIILRFYESCGQQTPAVITLQNLGNQFKIQTVEEVDLLEWKTVGSVEWKAVNTSNSYDFSATFSPYEIKTFRITFEDLTS
jgi:alpha-mannosidase